MNITLGKYQFHIVGRTTVKPNTSGIHNRDKKTESYEVFYIQTFNLDDSLVLRESTNPLLDAKPLIFGVYMSQSQMGFCRLASFHPTTIFGKGNDYSQTTLINFKLGQFIISKMQDSSIQYYPNGPYADAGPIIRENHLMDQTRITQIDNFGHTAPPQKCVAIKPGIYDYLQATSSDIKTKFPTRVGVEHICDHSYNTMFANVNGGIFKIILESAEAPPQRIEIYLYNYTLYLTENKTTVNGTIPVLMKRHNPLDPEDITEFGTYGNYISSYGAYICKLFEYNDQLPSVMHGVVKINAYYTFIGGWYNNLYPSEHLQAFLQQQDVKDQGGSKKSHRRYGRIYRRHNMSYKRIINKKMNYKKCNYKRKRTVRIIK
jgi:hypothetical protein